MLNDQLVLFQTIPFSISHMFAQSNSSIWPTDKTLSDATTPGQRGTKGDGNEGVLLISQSSSITGASPPDCFMLYQWYSLFAGSYPSVEMQSVYSTTPAHGAGLV